MHHRPRGTSGDLPDAAPGTRRVIRIVDDMADSLQFVLRVLEQAGYEVALHSSIAELAASYSTLTAQAILLDVHLGNEDATDALDFLKQQRAIEDIYLISGDPASLDCARRYAEEREIRIAGTLEKPFTGRNILELLERSKTPVDKNVGDIDIEEGFAKGWVYPVLQPKLDLRSNSIRSAELLVRIAHPDLGPIAPHDFVRRLSDEQAQALFLQNIAFARRHFAHGALSGNEFTINVNVDVWTLIQSSAELREFSEGSKNFYRNLVIEITEEGIAQLAPEDLKTLYKLSLKGARLAVDDFGTGHSNFSRLSRLPICEIKIDRSLVQQCAHQAQRQLIVRTIINMAHDLGARVVAEGVENYNDLAWLQSQGCDEVQGFLIGRPMRMERFTEFMARCQRSEAPFAAAR
jgi:EAL domain-containing protein (putative c-di-GMP-specific phosphodiesterase class I)/CheY-like chemotaxis protein